MWLTRYHILPRIIIQWSQAHKVSNWRQIWDSRQANYFEKSNFQYDIGTGLPGYRKPSADL